MGWSSVLRRALCLQDTVISSLAWRKDVLIVTVRPRKRDRNRCSRCQKRSPYYDALTEGRIWRSVDLGSIRVYLEADTHRVRCPDHGVVVAHVPWARASSRTTLAFEDLASWFAAQFNQTVVAEYLRTTWRSVGAAIRRKVTQTDWPLHTEHLERIGIDEISYRKGHRYLTIVVNHDTGRLIWAAPGRSKEVVHAFFDELGPDRCDLIQLVTRDAATWVSTVVKARCPNAEQCMDPFHVIKWATDAVDAVRRETWHAMEYWSCPGAARFIKGALWILRKNRPDLTKKQLRGLAIIQRDNKYLYRAYLLKEQLRLVFQLPLAEALRLLDRWLIWARRSQIPQFVRLAKTITQQRKAIRATLIHRQSQGRVEAMNTSIRLIARKAYGFHSPDSLIALAMLKLGGLTPALPGRAA